MFSVLADTLLVATGLDHRDRVDPGARPSHLANNLKQQKDQAFYRRYADRNSIWF